MRNIVKVLLGFWTFPDTLLHHFSHLDRTFPDMQTAGGPPLCSVATNRQSHHFLLVENDAEEAAILEKAFQAIPDCGTVSIARNASEAKAYLKGAGVYSDRQKFRFPSTILSSYRVDGDSGVD